MPLYCPCHIDAPDACRYCRHESDGRCWELFPSKALSELLTASERLSLLEAQAALQTAAPDLHKRITRVSNILADHIEMTTKAGKAKPKEPGKGYRGISE